MKFKKQFLLDEMESGENVVVNEYVENSRWHKHYRWVFRFDGKFYESFYRVGATENQYESPYEYDPEEIECKEVFPVIKTITVYE